MLSASGLTENAHKDQNPRKSSDSSSPPGYDAFKEHVQRDIELMQAEQLELTQQVASISTEHKRLKNEIFLSMQDNAEQVSQLIANASEERNETESVLDMWHVAVQEIDYLEKALAEKSSGKEFEERIEEIKAEYTKSLESLSEELAGTRIELRNLKSDLQKKSSLLEEKKEVIKNLSFELEKKENWIKDASLKERDMSSKIMSLGNILAESEKMLSEKNEVVVDLKKKFDDLLSTNEALKQHNVELKVQKEAAQKDAKENLLTTEKAVLEKQEAVYKEQQALKEIQLLKSSINQAAEQTASRFKSEIQSTEQRLTEKHKVLIKEIQALELENSEKQNAYEQAIREKKAVESELQSLYEKNAGGVQVSSSVSEDISRKLTEAERIKKEVELEAEALQTLLKDMKFSHQQGTQALQDECRRLKTRIQHLQTDFNDVLSERTQLADEVELLKKRYRKAEKELENVKSSHQNDVSLLEQKLQKKEHAYHLQLQMAEEQHKKTIAELQHLLDVQYDLSNKWKDEVQELTKKFESKIKDLYEDNIRLHQQNEEFSRVLQQKQAGFSVASYSSPFALDGSQMNAIYVNR